jgi:hypothetical protein
MIFSVWFMTICTPAGAGDWTHYRNLRYGTAADIPAHGFVARPPSENSDGQTWVSKDGRGQILVFGARVVTVDTIPAYRQETLGYARDDGVEIVYNVAKADWFAYSGYLEGDIVYEKVIILKDCDPMIANHLYFRYPMLQKKRFDPLVRHMAASLVGSRASDMCD